MLGVAYARHPVDGEGDEQVHLWKSYDDGEKAITYCTDFLVDMSLSNDGMTQVDQSNINRWKKQESICDECAERVDEQYNASV